MDLFTGTRSHRIRHEGALVNHAWPVLPGKRSRRHRSAGRTLLAAAAALAVAGTLAVAPSVRAATYGPINIGTSGIYPINGLGLTNILGGDITGSGTAVLQLENGIFVLAPTNPLGNNAGFIAQTLQIGDGADFTVAQFATGNGLDLPASTVGITLDRGTLQYTGSTGVTINNNLTVTDETYGNIINAGGHTITFTGSQVGSGALELTDGTIELNPANRTDIDRLSGPLDISSTATLLIDAQRAIPGGTIQFDGGTLENNSGGALTFYNNIIVSTTGGTINTSEQLNTFNGAITDAEDPSGPLTFTGGGIAILDNDNSYSTGTVITGGATLVAASPYALGTTTPTNNVNLTDSSTLETNNAYLATTQGPGYIGPGMTIDIGGSYTQSANSTLFLTFSGTAASGNYDSLALVNNQTATLNGGALHVQFAPGFTPKDFDTYTVVATTGEVFGDFATPVDVTPDNTGHQADHVLTLRAGHNDTGETMTVQTDFLSFVSGETPNEQAIAAYLNANATPALTPLNLQNILANLSQLPAGEVGPALDQLTPRGQQAMGALAIQNATFVSDTIYNQIDNQFAGLSGFDTSSLSLLDTPNTDPFTAALDSAMQSTAQQAANATNFLDSVNGAVPLPEAESNANTLSGFLAGQIIMARMPGSADQSTHFLTGGAITGLDYNVASHLLIGATFSYGYTNARLDDVGSALRDQSYTPGLFLGLRQSHFYIDATGSYTYNSYHMNRNVNIGGVMSTAGSTPHASQYDADAMAGYYFHPARHAKFGPAVGVGYTHVNTAGYSENGSPADLTVSPVSIDSLRSLFGGRFMYIWQTQPGTPAVHLSVNGFWQHEFLNGSRGLIATFTQLGTDSFVTNTGGPVRNTILTGGGLSGDLTTDVSIFVNYEAQIGQRKEFAQTVMTGLAIALR